MECCNNCQYLDQFEQGNQCLKEGIIINWDITEEHNLSSCFYVSNWRTMKIYKSIRKKEFESCCLCDKGKINLLGTDLLYPYEELMIIEGKKKIVLCPECFNTIKRLSNL